MFSILSFKFVFFLAQYSNISHLKCNKNSGNISLYLRKFAKICGICEICVLPFWFWLVQVRVLSSYFFLRYFYFTKLKI